MQNMFSGHPVVSTQWEDIYWQHDHHDGRWHDDSTFGDILKGAGGIAAGIYGGPAGAWPQVLLPHRCHVARGGGMQPVNDDWVRRLGMSLSRSVRIGRHNAGYDYCSRLSMPAPLWRSTGFDGAAYQL